MSIEVYRTHVQGWNLGPILRIAKSVGGEFGRSLSASDRSRRNQVRVLGRVLLSIATRSPLTEILNDSRVIYSPFGQPHFAERKNLRFSIAHSGLHVVLAVSCTPVGVDIEQARGRDLTALRSSLTTREEEKLDILAAERGDECAYLELWTRKEAVLKM